MRRNLTEQLSRMSKLMGLNEEPSIPGLKPSIEGADPKKADTVKDDLTSFYETLELFFLLIANLSDLEYLACIHLHLLRSEYHNDSRQETAQVNVRN